MADQAASPRPRLNPGRPLWTIFEQLRELALYERFESAVVIVLTILIIVVVLTATWRLAGVVGTMVATDEIHPANQSVFQTIFGMIFTVIIALEFKRSLLVVLERKESVVRVRSIILIAMLAMVRKFIILDLAQAAALDIFALSAAILALGIVYLIVRQADAQPAGD
jgi:uncharacterized membrane protein (DUF373 family)